MKEFKDLFMTKKEDILRIAEDGIKLINEKANSDKVHSSAYYHSLKSRLSDFIEYVNLSHLPELNDEFSYFVEVRTDAIVLYIKYVNEYRLIKETSRREYSTSDEYEIIKLPFKLLSIEEYESLNNTISYVVVQWIRRGKLKNAKKAGREWYISEIEEIVKDNKEAVYRWKTTNEKIFSDEYDYFNKYSKATIVQDSNSKTNYKLILYDDLTGEDKIEELTTNKKQKVETMLIGNENVKYINNLIIVLA